MSRKKLDQLFQAAHRVPAVDPSADFVGEVLRAIRQEPPPATPVAPAVFDQLNAMFPRLALAALVVMVLGLAANLALGTSDLTDFDDDAAQTSAQWYFVAEGD